MHHRDPLSKFGRIWGKISNPGTDQGTYSVALKDEVGKAKTKELNRDLWKGFKPEYRGKRQVGI